jgi:hypothetical protein
LSDIAPTILATAGIERPQSMKGSTFCRPSTQSARSTARPTIRVFTSDGMSSGR